MIDIICYDNIINVAAAMVADAGKPGKMYLLNLPLKNVNINTCR
ncbi:hypothetical protein DCCM_0223 [Desulfocucumis palustris]|uniref:Uncharacterized protein n=1 Tax=Desulfocucumis palustris TaxID=1898651 RepID=A0A2L2X7S3_9FIRM|nr:hypothetical protein DCCM_0223 [Desulfocucumis palustris]